LHFSSFFVIVEHIAKEKEMADQMYGPCVEGGNSATTICAPEPPQSQLAYATERLVLSTRLLTEVHGELNDYFYKWFGRNNLSDTKAEGTERDEGALPELLYAVQEMHRALDEVRSDVGFLKEQNL